MLGTRHFPSPLLPQARLCAQSSPTSVRPVVHLHRGRWDEEGAAGAAIRGEDRKEHDTKGHGNAVKNVLEKTEQGFLTWLQRGPGLGSIRELNPHASGPDDAAPQPRFAGPPAPRLTFQSSARPTAPSGG